jgi:DNA-binding cell septation regulator SpoVG
MFSYTFKTRKFNNPNSKLKAFVTIVIDDVLEMHGFKIIEGNNGLFVSAPSHKGTATVDGAQVEKYYDDIQFTGEEGQAIFKELKEEIIREFSSSSSPARTTVAKTQAKKVEASATSEAGSPELQKPERTRKPLWGF